jgi:hypothetical protein
MAEYNVGPRAPTLIEVVHCPKCGRLNRAPEFPPFREKMELTCHGCLAKPEVLRGDTFLKPIHYYWAVDCKRCSFVITLAETPHRRGVNRDMVGAFPAFCPACRRELEYEAGDVMVWAGPPPTSAFIAHPAFLKFQKH